MPYEARDHLFPLSWSTFLSIVLTKIDKRNRKIREPVSVASLAMVQPISTAATVMVFLLDITMSSFGHISVVRLFLRAISMC